MSAADVVSRARSSLQFAYRAMAMDARARWLRGAAQAFIDGGYDDERMVFLSQFEEVGHVFAEILAEIRRIRGQAS